MKVTPEPGNPPTPKDLSMSRVNQDASTSDLRMRDREQELRKTEREGNLTRSGHPSAGLDYVLRVVVCG